MTDQTKQNKSLILKLLAIVLGMFGFGFALVPLYDVFCDLTGLNGKTSNTAAVYEAVDIDESRYVTVEFITRINTGMSWQFEVETQQVKVHPGEMNQVNFSAKNPGARAIVGQAVPSVSPGTAAIYLNKTECFCFEQQILQAGEKIIMPMRFYVDPQIPKDMTYFTVQYTLYDVTTAEQQVALNRG
ncbi:MAG: cytochrome c oxidase assembly protein [Paraglaciecola sp.]|uniref:cytochrome c oxidase assembly protein n=1 Tax=Pseudomonadati TaxID=3379134 RepID=UPI00273D39FA|nr:cytochrome c oxidase assembly protein [Paraglaciecola sp.]MDP5029846.1 cytochrome c oxidase assembly protein [Paraglaciecola sp.]MDP5041451.1 cytochrome c oxidase assembly protein [Paraglaciecola sp.]MDP5130966.1 cytochrome c oxidase assembly protein [Paraglaciecola sp.]